MNHPGKMTDHFKVISIANRIIILVFILFPIVVHGQINASDLRCEDTKAPLLIDDAHPVLSWRLSSTARNKDQTAYELIVDTDEKSIARGRGRSWSSGKIPSGNVHAVYNGDPLQSHSRYYWSVRVFDEDGVAGTWAAPTFFETAKLSNKDWISSWISDGSVVPMNDAEAFGTDRMPLFRKEFRALKKIQRARLYVVGLGYNEVYINGKRVGNAVLEPGWTAYGKETLYSVHDVTAQIGTGSNVIGVMLGNGWWNPLPIKLFGRWDIREYQQTGRPCLKAEIHIRYHDNSTEKIVTDSSWLVAQGPVIRNSVYLGEWYDARLEQTNWNKIGMISSGWKMAVVVDGPSGHLRSQQQPPIRVTRVYKPVAITNPRRDTFIVDMGQNFAGVARIRVKGIAGQQIYLRYGEALHSDGTLNYATTVMTQIRKGGISGGPGAPTTAWQEDRYICKGGSTEVWSPRFTFHGFRYLEVTGWPGKPSVHNFEGLAMNADLEETGSFRCSNDSLNQLHGVVKNTFMSNVFSVQSDCPAREKLGYGADIQVTANSFMFNYGMRNFYRKAVRDFVNDQQADGGITETAPFVGIADRGYGGYSGPMGWQLAFPYLLRQLYQFYGDVEIVRTYYPNVRKQLAFLESKSVEGLFHWDIGDHEALDPRPEAFSASAFYYHHALLASELAGIAKQREDSVHFQKLASHIKQLIIGKYLVPSTGRFDNATQSAQIFALWYNLSPEKEKTFDVLMKEFERHNFHLSTGIFGTMMLFDVLRAADRNDVAYQIATQKDYPGWFHMLSKGATTLWETWEYPETYPSQNHPMFGSISEWFYRSLLGINPLSAGFRTIEIKPQPAGELTWASGHYESPRGKIASEWKIEGNSFFLNVEIPPACEAEIWIPASHSGGVTEGGKPFPGKIENRGNHLVLRIGSGKYHFSILK